MDLLDETPVKVDRSDFIVFAQPVPVHYLDTPDRTSACRMGRSDFQSARRSMLIITDLDENVWDEILRGVVSRERVEHKHLLEAGVINLFFCLGPMHLGAKNYGNVRITLAIEVHRRQVTNGEVIDLDSMTALDISTRYRRL